MAIRERIDDAKHLLACGRVSGALLSVCAAISATSRRRYPKGGGKRDREAFNCFLAEELRVVSLGRDVNLYVWCDACDRTQYPDGMMPFQDVIYTFVRCELAHEGGLSGVVEFLPDDAWTMHVQQKRLVLGGGVLRGMMRVPEFAPENIHEFPHVAEMSDDEIGERLFGETKALHGDYLQTRRARLASLQSVRQVES